MKRFWKTPYRFGLCFTVLLVTAFSWALLDTFVIPHKERIATEVRQTVQAVVETLAPQATSDTAQAETATQAETVSDTAQADASTEAGSAQLTAEATAQATAEPTATPAKTQAAEVTATSYTDGQISVSITTFRYEGTTCYAADVQIAAPELLYTLFAQNTFGRNVRQKTSEMAKQSGAILAINGDYYGSRNSGYVVRNGVVYRSTAASDGSDALSIDSAGNLGFASTLTSTELEAQWQVFTFGPALVSEGSICVDSGDEVGRAMLSNPRTAIGQISPLHYVFLVSDGRTDESEGLSLYDLAAVMQSLGCENAYNLDGGGSSTMVFMGQVVNNPTTNGRRITEREVSDVVCIGY